LKAKDTAQVALRVPGDLKDQVKDAAAREGRSMNAQIVHHLREIYTTKGEGGTA
jgi:hypothetical protein